MAIQQTPYTLPVFLAGFIGLGIAVFAFRHRGRPGAKPMAVFMAGASVWSFAEGLNLLFVGAETKRFWVSVEISAASVVVLCFFIFVLEYTGNEEWLTRRRLGLLLVEPVAITLLSFGARDLVLTSAETHHVGSFLMLTETYGPAFYVHTVYSYVLVLTAMVLLAGVFVKSEGVYRSQSGAIIFAGGITALGNAAWVLKIAPIDTTSLGFLVGGIVITGTILRRQLLELVPMTQEVARDAIFNEMDDPVIVLDERGTVTELNPAAVELLDGPESDALGQDVGDAFPAIGRVVDTAAGERKQAQLSIETDGEIRYYDVQVTPLRRVGGVTAGRLVSLRDVTTQRQQRQRVDVLNRLLRHNLRNEMNVITGNAELLERELSDDALVDRVERIEETATEITSRSDKVGQVTRMLDRDAERGIDLTASIRRIASRAAEDHPEADVTVDVPEGLYADVGPSVEVAIDELLANAIEHGDGAVAVDVTAREDDDTITVEVTDDGPGVDDHEFEVLSEGRETALRHGSGVGLWVVNWIVEQFGGRLDWETDDGSTVLIHLPAQTGVPEPDREVTATPSD